MNAKIISFFLVITLAFPLESRAMSALAQRFGWRTTRVTQPRPKPTVSAQPKLAQSKVSQPTKSSGVRGWFSRNFSWSSWFGSNAQQQKRYFSSTNVPSSQSALLLVEAIKSGSEEELRELIRKGLVDINARYENNETILHIAVKNDVSSQIITLLIDVGANINAKDYVGYTPLHDAVNWNNVKAVKLLVAKGANPNVTTSKEPENTFDKVTSYFSSKGKSPLYIAQEKDRPSQDTLEIIDFLKPLTDKSLWFVVTPERSLLRAILNNRIAEIKNLLTKHTFSKDTLNKMLIDAATRYDIAAEIIAILLDAGADIDIQDSFFKRTALHYASQYNNLALVKLLLSRGANPNILDRKGLKPLDFADNLEIFKILEELTVKRNTSMPLEGEALAAEYGRLLQKAIEDVDVNAVKQILAAYKFSKNTLNDALIDSSKGYEPARADILAALISAGANVDAKDYLLKRTALHYAVHYQNPAAVTLLLSKKANPNIVDYQNRAPIYLVQKNDDPSKEAIAIIKLLEPVTDRTLWFVVTPEIMLRRAVKRNKLGEVRSALELEQEPIDFEKEKTQESAQQKAKRAKKFTATGKF